MTGVSITTPSPKRFAELKSPEEAGSSIATAWAEQYRVETAKETELVEVELGTFTYLFDIAHQRVVGVYGLSAPTDAPRPTARMRGHPSYNNPGEAPTDRGHLAAHTIGGGTDINLVPQAHALNVSRAWRNCVARANNRVGFGYWPMLPA